MPLPSTHQLIPAVPGGRGQATRARRAGLPCHAPSSKAMPSAPWSSTPIQTVLSELRAQMHVTSHSAPSLGTVSPTEEAGIKAERATIHHHHDVSLVAPRTRHRPSHQLAPTPPWGPSSKEICPSCRGPSSPSPSDHHSVPCPVPCTQEDSHSDVTAFLAPNPEPGSCGGQQRRQTHTCPRT